MESAVTVNPLAVLLLMQGLYEYPGPLSCIYSIVRSSELHESRHDCFSMLIEISV